MNFDWKKALKATAVLAAIGTISVILSKNNNDEFQDWLQSASDEELSDGYEQRRQQWAKDGYGGNGEKTPEMKQIDREKSRRSAENGKTILVVIETRISDGQTQTAGRKIDSIL